MTSSDLPDSWDDEPWPLDDIPAPGLDPTNWSDTHEEPPQVTDLADEAWEYALDHGISLEKALVELQHREQDKKDHHKLWSSPWGQQQKTLSNYSTIEALLVGGPENGKVVNVSPFLEVVQVAIYEPVTIQSITDPSPQAIAPLTAIYRRDQPVRPDLSRWVFDYEGPNAYTVYYKEDPLPYAPVFSSKYEAHSWFHSHLEELTHNFGPFDLSVRWTLPER